MWIHFLRTIFLLPYGKQLLRPAAGTWAILMALLAGVMATVEGYVWMTISKIILPSEYILISIVLGIIVFALIWIFDASLITLDLSEPIYKIKKKDKKSWLIMFFTGLFSKKLGWGVAFRVIVVTTSILVTAPLLSQIFLEKEILRRIDEHNRAIVADFKAKTDGDYNRKISALRTEVNQAKKRFQEEVAGVGTSGRYGFGITAKTIQQHTDDLEMQFNMLNTERSNFIREIEKQRTEEIIKKYKLEGGWFDNFETRNMVHKKIKEDYKGIPKSEVLASVFLGLLFLVMVVLKIFQPTCIDIYYNDQLHEMYDKYVKGFFNSKLNRNEHPGGISPMDAHRFEEWIYYTWIKTKDNDEKEAEKSQIKHKLEDLLGEFEHKEAKQKEAIKAVKIDIEETKVDIEKLIVKQQEFNNRKVCKEHEFVTIKESLDELKRQLATQRSGDVIPQLIDIKTKLVNESTLLKKDIDELNLELAQIDFDITRIMSDIELMEKDNEIESEYYNTIINDKQSLRVKELGRMTNQINVLIESLDDFS